MINNYLIITSVFIVLLNMLTNIVKPNKKVKDKKIKISGAYKLLIFIGNKKTYKIINYFNLLII